MRTLRLATALVVLLAATAPARADHPVTRAGGLLTRVTPLVEEVCGANFEKAPTVKELSVPEAMALFAKDVRPQLERKYKGVTPGQMRFIMRQAAVNSVQSCVARYSVTGKTIVLVRAGFDRQCRALSIPREQIEAFLTFALAHECVHALDDARFDLGKLFRESADEEALRAVNMVVEGRGTHFGDLVAARLRVPPEIRAHVPGGAAPSGEHEWLLALSTRFGRAFVADLLKRGGRNLADRALREPPAVTHLVCQPGRWPDARRSKLTRANQKALTAFGAPATATRMSELLLRVRYTCLHGPATARTLFGGYRDGVQVVVGTSNVAVLEFADAAGARRYAERSRRERMTLVRWREGDRAVLRVSGKDSAEVMARLRKAAKIRLR